MATDPVGAETNSEMETYIQMKNGSVYATAIFLMMKAITTQMQMEQRNSYAVLSTGFEGSAQTFPTKPVSICITH